MVVPVEELELHVGIVGLKFFQHAGQPVDGDGGEGADAHRAAVQATDRGGQLVELFLTAKQSPHRGHQPLPLGGEADPGPAALEQGEAQLALQTVQTVAHGRLGTAQRPGGQGQAALLHHRGQHLIFGYFHGMHLL